MTAALAAAVLFTVLWYRQKQYSETLAPYEEADSFAGIGVYAACDPSIRVSFLPASAVGSGDLQDASDYEETDLLYLFLPYSTEVTQYHIGLPKGWTLLLDGRSYAAGDILENISDGKTYSAILRSADGTIRAEKKVQTEGLSAIPALFMTMKEEDYASARSSKLVRENCSYSFYKEDGTVDAHGSCLVGGHGGSTFEYHEKKPFKFYLDDTDSILGMSACRKYLLLSNPMDGSQMKNRIVYEAARRIGLTYTPECRSVNLYVNGEYQGLYLISQKIGVEDGTVSETSLDDENKLLNPDYDSTEPVVETDPSGYQQQYFSLQKNPPDISGTYLMEVMYQGYFSDNYDKDDDRYEYTKRQSWINLGNEEIRIKSPNRVTKEELEYIAGIIRPMSEAFAAENGRDPSSGRYYTDYIDLASWGAQYLIQDFFALQDQSYGSVFMYKKRGDDKIYAGPIWDYDKSMTDSYYNWDDVEEGSDEDPFPWYGQANIYELMHDLGLKEDFREYVKTVYQQKLSAVMDGMVQNEIPQMRDELMASGAADDLRWGRDEGTFADRSARVVRWVTKRTELFDAVWVMGENSPYADNLFQGN